LHVNDTNLCVYGQQVTPETICMEIAKVGWPLGRPPASNRWCNGPNQMVLVPNIPYTNQQHMALCHKKLDDVTFKDKKQHHVTIPRLEANEVHKL